MNEWELRKQAFTIKTEIDRSKICTDCILLDLSREEDKIYNVYFIISVELDKYTCIEIKDFKHVQERPYFYESLYCQCMLKSEHMDMSNHIILQDKDLDKLAIMYPINGTWTDKYVIGETGYRIWDPKDGGGPAPQYCDIAFVDENTVILDSCTHGLLVFTEDNCNEVFYDYNMAYKECCFMTGIPYVAPYEE